MVTPQTLRRLHGIDDAATALGVSTYSIRRLIAAKQIKSVNIGARVMISTEEIERIQRDGVGIRRVRTNGAGTPAAAREQASRKTKRASAAAQ